MGSEYQDGDHCDGADNDLPWCLEVDWIESNGHCGAATTLHTKPGPGDDGCTAWGCRVSYDFNGVNQYHMKITYGSDGSWKTYLNGNELSGWNIQPGGSDWSVIKNAHESTGAVVYASEWTGWVPVDHCGTNPGNLDGSSFSVSNLVIEGSVVQGPEPTKCSPSPSPSPTPSGQCTTQPGQNNNGVNLESSARSAGSPGECCSMCAAAANCVGYTHVTANGECWLKSSLGGLTSDSDVTSGSYQAPAPTPSPGQCTTQPGQNNNGVNLESSARSAGSPDECCSMCAAAANCVGYTHVTANDECWLKSSLGGLTSDSDVTSGSYQSPAPTPVPLPVPTPTPIPVPPPTPTPVPSPAHCTCGCTGDDLKACMEACPAEDFETCIGVCTDPCPSTTTLAPPTPVPSPSGCPGGSLAACISGCPTDADLFEPCVDDCQSRCAGTSCTGGDDGNSLATCIGGCPSDKYAECIDCCEDKFPGFDVLL